MQSAWYYGELLNEEIANRFYKGKYKVYQNKYVDYAHDIEVEMTGGKFGIIFETDGKRVVSYRIGKAEQVGYVEGCS